MKLWDQEFRTQGGICKNWRNSTIVRRLNFKIKVFISREYKVYQQSLSRFEFYIRQTFLRHGKVPSCPARCQECDSLSFVGFGARNQRGHTMLRAKQ